MMVVRFFVDYLCQKPANVREVVHQTHTDKQNQLTSSHRSHLQNSQPQSNCEKHCCRSVSSQKVLLSVYSVQNEVLKQESTLKLITT